MPPGAVAAAVPGIVGKFAVHADVAGELASVGWDEHNVGGVGVDADAYAVMRCRRHAELRRTGLGILRATVMSSDTQTIDGGEMVAGMRAQRMNERPIAAALGVAVPSADSVPAYDLTSHRTVQASA